MNIEELNNCFEAMTPTNEQKEKMLAGIMNAKTQPVKVVKFHRYATAAAAVLAVGVFAAVYSNVGTNGVTPQVGNTTVAVESSESEYANVKKAEIQADLTEPAVEEKNITEQFKETYPELADGNTANTNVAVAEKTNEKFRSLPEIEEVHPEVADVTEESQAAEAYSYDLTPKAAAYDAAESDNFDEEISSGATSGGSAAGGGGGGSSAYMSVNAESLSINEVMTDSVYSGLMPTIYANKFNFRTAEKQSNRLKVIFENESGNYMSVSIIKDGEYDFYEEIVTPKEIKNLTSYGYVNFAVKCGEYYVIYNVEAYDVSEIYNMVISSAYFNN